MAAGGNSTVINEYYTTNIVSGGEYNDSCLKADTVKYLPISYNAAQLNAIIENTPHNLNSFTLVFLFVVPEEYQGEDYICDIKNKCIEFHNFYNGDLIVCR